MKTRYCATACGLSQIEKGDGDGDGDGDGEDDGAVFAFEQTVCLLFCRP